ncbi:LysR family transcriptional regulator [Aquabacter spiritensis]|uniref:DNA-binding transcriptional LysR family regulator n=1 Tax=Aquabacter spiritensis TaxID=933073 RepID=A0A4V2UYS8_9HYPH|nr:LysR family transcriptional regulator [Aquabacter spiritensis]TCT08318.1 DNA-binding transcriptional LysR family regulator [Aquabacter spiritensis]
MNKFLALSVFTRVADSGGFTAAARKLGMSVSAVTKTITRLEDELGTQLFNRTTRQLSTTDYGQEFYERAVQILTDLEDAELALQRGNVATRGRIRAVVPLSFGRVTLVPELPAFLSRYPDITLDLNFSDSNKPIDLVAEGYDVAVRTGHITDSRLITRLLLRSPQVTVAAPAYLKANGTPRTPQDLIHHNCITGNRTGPEWHFANPKGPEIIVHVKGNAVLNSGDALREAAVAGLGIIRGTWWLVRKDLERGDVESILADYAVEGTPISVLYPANRHLPAKVRVFLDFLISITRMG